MLLHRSVPLSFCSPYQQLSPAPELRPFGGVCCGSVQISLAIIQSHTCKVNLSATFHDAGVLHFVQTGTDMVSGGKEYRNKHSWYAPGGLFVPVPSVVSLSGSDRIKSLNWMDPMRPSLARCRYLYLSSNDYPRLFLLKHLSYIKASRVALMSKNDDAWTRTSARWRECFEVK